MSDHAEVLAEEFEVLESIFPDELEKLSEDALRIRVEPEEAVLGAELVVSLQVNYTASYPDELPELQLEALEGDLSEQEVETLLQGMRSTGEESLGMAMVFTLTSWLKEGLTEVLEERSRKVKEAEDRKAAEYEEAEAAKKRGTAVTPESFMTLQKKIAVRARQRRLRAEEEKVKSLSGKEREEYKKVATRATGRQLFETGKTSAQADVDYEDDDTGAEFSYDRYSREERDRLRLEQENAEAQHSKGLPVDYDSD